MPMGQTGQISRKIKNRTRHLRLNGADLYVVRLGQKSPSANDVTNMCCAKPELKDGAERTSQPHIGSLYDGLVNPDLITQLWS